MVTRATAFLLTALVGPLLFLSSLHASADLPAPQGIVSDYNGTLDDETKQALITLIREVEQETSAEIAVAVVSSLEGMSVEEYASALFKQWGVGQKPLNNGVLVLVSPTDRTMRIEVGYGLEAILPDGLSGEIIRRQFLPKFRENDYRGGIRDGVDRLAAILRAKHIVTPEERARLAAAAAEGNGPDAYWLLAGFLSIFVAVGMTFIGLGVRAKTVGPIFFGLIMGGVPMALGYFILPASFAKLLGLVSAGAFSFGIVKGGKRSWRKMARGTATESGWDLSLNSSSGGGGSSSDSGSSSSSSSSSDSFGGGSSGGGGASGSW